MSQMDYARRPLIAGKSTAYLTYGTIRGNTRRSDADGTSTVPYFPAVSATQTLILSIDGSPFTVTLTSNGISQIIADINTAIGAAGRAFNADGTIAIQTATAGSVGYVQVTGGTAAAGLGFDLVAQPIFKSSGGDLESAPESRSGQLFGTSFPTTGDNLVTDTITRGLARISANADVLYSDVNRFNVSVQKVSFTTSDNRLLTVSPATTRLLTSGLNNASTAQELAPYFFMLDSVTKVPARSRVIGVVRGSVVGSPPFANATAWAGGGSTGNVLGQDLIKVSAATITDIKNGRVLVASGANFVDVVEGDFVSIASATNVTPWTNNGYKWVVEEVISTTALALRPMSKTELALVGGSHVNEQPIVELNANKGALESYGTITVRTGAFCSAVNVIVDPPIPVGATYELYAAVPESLRSSGIAENYNAAALRELASVTDPVENWVRSGMVASLSGGNCSITAGSVRWHGRVYNVVARTLAVGSFTNGTSYVYWDETTGDYAIENRGTSTNWRGHLSVAGPGKGLLVAMVVVSAGTMTVVTSTARGPSEKSLTLTVGANSQFANLAAAAEYVSAYTFALAELDSATGDYPHFEVVMTSNLTLSSDVTFSAPGITIRGVNPGIQLTATARIILDSYNIKVCDFRFSSNASALLRTTNEIASIVIDGVYQNSSGVIGRVIESGGGFITEGIIQNCRFNIWKGISNLDSDGGSQRFSVLNSTFAFTAGASEPHIFEGPTSGAPWTGASLVIRDCTFQDFAGGDGLNPLFVETFASVVMENVVFGLGDFAQAATWIAICSGYSHFKNVHMTSGKIAYPLVLGPNSYVEDCTFTSNGVAEELAAITAGFVYNTKLSHLDQTSGPPPTSCIGVSPYFAAVGNLISGSFETGIKPPTGTSDVYIAGNSITLVDTTHSWVGQDFTVAGGGIAFEWSAGTPTVGVTIDGNKISVPNSPSGSGACAAINLTGVTGVVRISDNALNGPLVGTVASSQLTISNNLFTGTRNNAVFTLSSGFAKISDCSVGAITLTSGGELQVNNTSAGIVTVTGGKIQIANSRVTNLVLSTSDSVHVSGVQATGNADSTFAGTGGATSYLVIDNCSFYASALEISMTDTDTCISNSRLKRITFSPDSFSRLAIANNTIYSTATDTKPGHALWIYGSTTSQTYHSIQITGNYIRMDNSANAQTFMYQPILLGPNGATVRTVTNVVVSGNRIRATMTEASLSSITTTQHFACIRVNTDTADKRVRNILITGNFLEKPVNDSTAANGGGTVNNWYIHANNSERVLLDGNFAFDGPNVLAPVNSGRRGEIVVAVTPGPGNYTLNNT